MSTTNVEIIKQCLVKAGFTYLPQDPNQKLSDFGMDSLYMVLTIAEIEKEFKKNVPVANFNQANFATINSIIEFLIQEKIL